MNCNRYKIVALCLLLFLPLTLFAAKKTEGYKIDITAPAKKDSLVMLGHYHFGKLYTKDSIRLNGRGKGSFVADSLLKEGLYVIYFNQNQYFDVLIGGDQHIGIEVDTLNLPQNLKFSQSQETKDFYDYSIFLGRKQKEARDKNAQIKELTDTVEIEKIKAEIALLSAEVNTKQKALMTAYEGKMLGVFLKGLIVPELPDYSAYSDSMQQVLRYQFYKNHFFDNMDLSDERLYKTPYITNNLETYLNKVLYQVADSVIPPAIQMIETSRKNPVTFRYICDYLLNYSVKSNVMGMDNLMVKLGKDYYLSGVATWADSALKSSLEKEIAKIETSLVGMKAQNIALCDTLGNYRKLYDMGGETLTVLYFYEPTCGHCKKTTPVLKEAFEPYKNDKRVRVVAVYMLTDEKEWKDFIKDNRLEAFDNVWDPARTSYYWHYFDTSTTPMMYVLDKDKKIFAKRIDVESLKRIFTYELK